MQVDRNFQGRLAAKTHTSTLAPPLAHYGAPRERAPLHMVVMATQHPISTPTTPGANSQDITPYFARIGELKGCTRVSVGPFRDRCDLAKFHLEPR